MSRINIHFLHDEESHTLARRIFDWHPTCSLIKEPTDDIQWSGVRIYDEDKGRWITSLRWQRGGSRDIEQAAQQLATAIKLHVNEEPHKPKKVRVPRTEEGTVHDDHQFGLQSVDALYAELGVDASGARTRRAWTRRKRRPSP